LSLFGWGSSKSNGDFKDLHASKPPESAAPAPDPEYLGSSRTFKASHSTSDQADPSITLGNPGENEPEILKNVEDLLAKSDKVAPEDLASVPERIGYLKEVCGIDFGWGTSTMFQWVIEYTHIYTGLGWGATFIAICVLGRIVMFRAAVKGQEMSARMKEVQPILNPLREAYKEAVAARDQKTMNTVQAQMRAVTRESGISMWTIFKPLVYQIPFNFAGYRLSHAMGALPVPALHNEAIFWLNDLSMTDLWILPTVSAAITFLTMRMNINATGGAAAGSGQAAMQRVFQYVLPVISWAFLRWQPGVGQVFFLTQAISSALQVSAFSNNTARRMLGLAPHQKRTPGTTTIVSPSPTNPSPTPATTASSSTTTTAKAPTPTTPGLNNGMRFRRSSPSSPFSSPTAITSSSTTQSSSQSSSPPSQNHNPNSSPSAPYPTPKTKQSSSKPPSTIDKVIDNIKAPFTPAWDKVNQSLTKRDGERREKMKKMKNDNWEYKRRQEEEAERRRRNEWERERDKDGR
jgi:YidC/Oxa1 family membrane protein insertase